MKFDDIFRQEKGVKAYKTMQ